MVADLYRWLLRAYPYDYRCAFAAEMQAAFEDGASEKSTRWLLVEFQGVVRGVIAEWFAKWTTDSVVRGRALPDLRMMRPVGISQVVWYRK